MNLIFDANVVIKAYIPEILSDRAEELFNRIEDGKIILIAPDLIYPEMGNILWKKYKLRELTLLEIKRISDAILSLPLQIESSRKIIQLAIDLGIIYNVTVYDALYISLAKIYKTRLVTADKKLINSLMRTPLKDCINWLGDNIFKNAAKETYLPPLLVVSNRLPITVAKEGGSLIFQRSAGGLVSGISAYLGSLNDSLFTASEYMWIGWPGVTVEDIAKEDLKLKILTDFNAYPVFLSEDVMENFYHGFCNKTIWPLFHYFPSFAVYDEAYWSHYRHVNETFCSAVMEVIKPDDVVWIHDYHLMLLPMLLREKMPDVPIGFFLHIPFPAFEIFQLLPMKWRGEILQGLLGADLIGFHTFDYTQCFLRCVLRILGHDHNMGEIAADDHLAKADTFPMGIDFGRFNSSASSPEAQAENETIKKNLPDFKVILSVDRLDYTKGIVNRLQGFEIFLEKNRQWHRKVILVLIVVPSLVGVESYQQPCILLQKRISILYWR